LCSVLTAIRDYDASSLIDCLKQWSWATNVPESGADHLQNIVTGAQKLALVIMESATSCQAFAAAIASRASAQFVAHQLLAIVLARVPREGLQPSMQALFDGVTTHAVRLLEDADAITRIYLGLGGALVQLPLAPVERFLWSNTLVHHPMASYLLGQLWSFVLRHSTPDIQGE
jgi:hypothetical protein